MYKWFKINKLKNIKFIEISDKVKFYQKIGNITSEIIFPNLNVSLKIITGYGLKKHYIKNSKYILMKELENKLQHKDIKIKGKKI